MKNFRSIGRNMMIADKYFKLYLRDALQPYGLNAAEGVVLLMLYEKAAKACALSETEHATAHSGKTQDELIREIHYDKGVMTRTMKELEQKGYVVREQNPLDSRSYLFSLSDKGLAFKDTLTAVLQKWNRALLDGLSTEQLVLAETVLSRMAQNAADAYSGKSPDSPH